MADEATLVKTIADNIEETFKSLKRAASNIAGLLQVGRATCDEVRAYNLWALSIYNEQRGMLEAARRAGNTGLPALPPSPTLFVWKGVRGEDAWKINCSGQEQSLSGMLRGAMRGVDANTQFLSTNEIQIQTQDQFALDPERAPSFATLWQTQQARAQQAGLGAAFLLVIAGISILAISAAIVAIAQYLKTKEIQESNSRQVRLQADAFANYTAARLQCYSECLKTGQTAQHCVELCKQIVDKPNIKVSFAQPSTWGFLQWTGFVVVLGIGSFAAYKIYERRRAGKPILELPDFDTARAA